MANVDLRPVEVFSYAELVQLAVPRDNRVEEGRSRFVEAMGPSGPGLIGVNGISRLPSLREALLLLAPTLALSSHQERSTILKAHGLGTDVSLKDPERLVSSFASQLSFGQGNDGKATCLSDRLHDKGNELDHLGSIFRQLGKEMIELGLLVARVCDASIKGASLENAILAASTAKGRLIHYHSLAEKRALQRSKMGKQKRMQGSMRHPLPSCRDRDEEDLWQQWHFDYGIFTILTSPMFLRSNQTGPDSRETGAFSPHIGLKVLNTSNRKAEYVCAPDDCLLVQVGEAAEILTGGKLRAVAHCVCRPPERGDDDVSRETFVVFLQPSWDTCLVSPSPSEHDSLMVKRLQTDAMDEGVFSAIQRQVPSLESRWRSGCTFAEFSRETTKQYYGTNGAQAKK